MEVHIFSLIFKKKSQKAKSETEKISFSWIYFLELKQNTEEKNKNLLNKNNIINLPLFRQKHTNRPYILTQRKNFTNLTDK